MSASHYRHFTTKSAASLSDAVHMQIGYKEETF